MGSIPTLDFSNPLHYFGNGGDGLTYTASGDCYLYGTPVGGSGHGITINGKPIISTPSSFNSVVGLPITKLTSGDSVVCSTTEVLYVLKEK